MADPKIFRSPAGAGYRVREWRDLKQGEFLTTKYTKRGGNRESTPMNANGDGMGCGGLRDG